MPKKKEKNILDEFINPSAKIPYDNYVRIITKVYGAIEGKRSHSGGSKRSFTITVGDETKTFVLHERHSKKDYVGKWDHHNVLYILKSLGLVKDREEKDEEGKK